MPTHEFWVLTLKREVETILAAAGDTTPHAVGARERNSNARWPRYIWVPTRTRGSRKNPKAPITEHRRLFVTGEHLEIDCFGGSLNQASALAHNLKVALYHARQIDVQAEGGEMGPQEAWTQDGVVYRFELSHALETFDEFINTTTLEYPDPETFIPERFDGQVAPTADLDEDGDDLVIRVIS